MKDNNNNNTERKEFLENIIMRKSNRVQITGEPVYDFDLMNAYLNSSVIYSEEGNKEKSEKMFGLGVDEFSNMVTCRNKLPVKDYKTELDMNSYDEKRNGIVKSLIGCESHLRDIADKIGYDTMLLVDIPTIKGRDNGQFEKFNKAKPYL